MPAGVYILAGQTAYETAGPGVVLSFLIAALASLFAGACVAVRSAPRSCLVLVPRDALRSVAATRDATIPTQPFRAPTPSAALCYAELASVAPSAGTAYSYSYVGIGEFPAFFVGWNLLLEYAIGQSLEQRARRTRPRAVMATLTSSVSLSCSDGERVQGVL